MYTPNHFRRALLFAIAAASIPHMSAKADEDFPNRPIRLVVPLAAGGVTDAIARIIAKQMSKELSGSVIVENRAGGNSEIGNTFVAQSNPDGYTLLLATPSLAIDPALGRKLSYDALKDFTFIGLMASSPNYLVVSSGVPANDIKALVDLVHRNPGKYNYGHPGVGTTAHLSFELFKLAAELDAVAVPYKGSAPMLTDLAEGRVQMTSMAAILTMSQAKAGRIKVLATTAKNRTIQFPDVPTMAEAGYPKAMVTAWFGIAGPAGMPENVTNRLVDALTRTLQVEEVKKQLAVMGAEVERATPTEFRSMIESDTAKWMDVVQQVGLTINDI